MDMSSSRASMRLQQSGTVDYSTIPAVSPLRVAPLIREVIRAAANQLMLETGLLRKNVGSSAPCFAIRTKGFNDLPLMTDALSCEVWELVTGTLAPEDIQSLFSTCTVMKACLEKYIDKAERQYAKSAEKILAISKDEASTDERVKRKLTRYFDRHHFVKIPLSKAKRKPEILAALDQNKSIKLLHIDARNIDSKITGRSVGLSFFKLFDATIELDISDNNAWSYFNLLEVFYDVSESNRVSSLILDRNDLRDVQLGTNFFRMLFSPTCRIRNLSLAGTGLNGCLSDSGMSLLAYGLMFNQPASLETLNLSSTPAKPGLTPYPKGAGLLSYPSYKGNLDPLSFEAFSRQALKNDKKNGLELIIEALKKNTIIKAINLSDCQIGDQMTKIIAGSLQKNTILKKLYLGNNILGNEGIIALGKALTHNRSLEVLNLNSCTIGDTGAAALAAMLKANGTLKELILSNNPITVKGMTALAKSLNGHVSIRLLDLAGNHIPLTDVSIFEQIVTSGIQVRVNTGIEYKAANENADVIEHNDVWLEPS